MRSAGDVRGGKRRRAAEGEAEFASHVRGGVAGRLLEKMGWRDGEALGARGGEGGGGAREVARSMWRGGGDGGGGKSKEVRRGVGFSGGDTLPSPPSGSPPRERGGGDADWVRIGGMRDAPRAELASAGRRGEFTMAEMDEARRVHEERMKSQADAGDRQVTGTPPGSPVGGGAGGEGGAGGGWREGGGGMGGFRRGEVLGPWEGSEGGEGRQGGGQGAGEGRGERGGGKERGKIGAGGRRLFSF